LTNYINIIKDFLVKKQNNFYYFFVFNIYHTYIKNKVFKIKDL
jgi:hypothetical protein